jgi:hypothetical protein
MRVLATGCGGDAIALQIGGSRKKDGAGFLASVEDIREMLKHRKGRKTNSSPDSAPLLPSATVAVSVAPEV